MFSILFRAPASKTYLDPLLVVVLYVLLNLVYQFLHGLELAQAADLGLEVAEEASDDAVVIAVPLVRHAPLVPVLLGEFDIDLGFVQLALFRVEQGAFHALSCGLEAVLQFVHHSHYHIRVRSCRYLMAEYPPIKEVKNR